MRVLHIMSGYGGGISSFIYNKAIALKNESVTFDVATYDECAQSFTDAIEAMGGQVFRLENPKKQGWNRFKTSYQAILKSKQYDAIHCHITGYRAFLYFVLSKKFVERFFLHAHTTTALYVKGTKRKILRFIDQTINKQISSSYLGCGKLAIQAIYGSVPDKEMMIVPNSISIERFLMPEEAYFGLKQTLRTQYRIMPNQLVIGQIGRLHQVKNTEHTLNIAKYIKDYQLNAKIFIIGSGDEEARLKEIADKLSINDQIKFLGRFDQLETIMPLLDVIILPSHYEGFPTVVVEAQTMGIPTLVSDSVTDEVDFQMGLVEYLPLASPVEEWYQALISLGQTDYVPLEKRQQTINSYGFTNKQSAKIYLDFLYNKINTHQIN